MKTGIRISRKNVGSGSKAKVLLLSLLAIVAATENTVHAGANCTPRLYGTSFQGSDGLADFYAIDPASGTATFVGETGFERTSAIDVDPITNTIYAIAERSSDDQKVLISIDHLTGVGEEEATISLGALDPKEHIAGMSFDNSGTLYGFGSRDQGFYSISVPDGAVERITVNELANGQGNGITFSPGGTLYHLDSDNIRTVNPANGVLTVLSPPLLSYDFPFLLDDPKPAAMDYDPDTDTYYVIVKESNEGETFLATLDIPTRVISMIGSTADFMDGLAYFCESTGQTADIDIEKSTNGEDADTAPGPSIDVGQPVTWTYVVTNTGQVTLSNITVNDDMLGAISCPQTTLAPGANMTCTENGVATAGQYANIGNASGTPPSGTPVSDSDRSHYTGVELSDRVFWDGFETR